MIDSLAPNAKRMLYHLLELGYNITTCYRLCRFNLWFVLTFSIKLYTRLTETFIRLQIREASQRFSYAC